MSFRNQSRITPVSYSDPDIPESDESTRAQRHTTLNSLEPSEDECEVAPDSSSFTKDVLVPTRLVLFDADRGVFNEGDVVVTILRGNEGSAIVCAKQTVIRCEIAHPTASDMLSRRTKRDPSRLAFLSPDSDADFRTVLEVRLSEVIDACVSHSGDACKGGRGVQIRYMLGNVRALLCFVREKGGFHAVRMGDDVLEGVVRDGLHDFRADSSLADAPSPILRPFRILQAYSMVLNDKDVRESDFLKDIAWFVVDGAFERWDALDGVFMTDEITLSQMSAMKFRNDTYMLSIRSVHGEQRV